MSPRAAAALLSLTYARLRSKREVLRASARGDGDKVTACLRERDAMAHVHIQLVTGELRP